MSSIDDIVINNAKLFITLVTSGTIEEKIANVIKCLNEGANVNERFINYFNNAPLHIAVRREETDIVKLLLEKGADVTLKNHEGKTALDIANDLNTDTSRTIIEILQAYDQRLEQQCTTLYIANCSSVKENVEKNKLSLYKKRGGTTGIKGELYETKLLSLILIRILLKQTVNQFYLGTSIQGIGSLDDICLRFKENNKDSVVFLQAKHITKGKLLLKDLWDATGNYSLSKYFKSYLKIRNKFESKNNDDMFQGRYEDMRCHFIIYTTAENLLSSKKILNQHSVDKTVKEILSTRGNQDIFQLNYDAEDIKFLTKKIMLDRMKQLGKKLYQFTEGYKFKNMLRDKLVRDYHVVLAQRVVAVTGNIVDDARIGSFREDFLSSNNEFLIALKDSFFKEAVMKTKINNVNLINIFKIAAVKPSAENISKLLQIVPIEYDLKTNRLDILNNNMKELVSPFLYEMVVTRTTFNEAIQIAVEEKLGSLKFKLPLEFGNVDFKISKKDVETILDNIALKIANTISEFGDKNIVINSRDKVDPLLIGNLFVFDVGSSMFKFNTSAESLAHNANTLLNKLQTKINELDTYKFQFNTDNIPKVTFDTDERDDRLAKDFLNNLWFYTRQAKEHEIEVYAKYDLADYYNLVQRRSQNKFSKIQSDAIFLKIHDEVQKWWLLETMRVNYITNTTQIFDNILNDSMDSQLLSILNYVYISGIQKLGIDFNEHSVNSLRLDTLTGLTVIETGSNALTSMKLHQYFCKKNNYTFIDLNYLSNLSFQDNKILLKELENNEKETIIIIYEDISKVVDCLNDILNLCLNKNIILVTNEFYIQKVMNTAIGSAHVKVRDENNNFRDLTMPSQANILKKKLIFQGIEVNFKTLIDTESQHLITEIILKNICRNETIKIGKNVSTLNYEEIKNYYVQRSLYRSKVVDNITVTSSESASSEDESIVSDGLEELFKIKTLEDIEDTVVLMAAPGMGKSTLLTHLSIETKNNNPGLWIVRVNLLDHAAYFNNWQQKKFKINELEAIRFLCKTVTSKHLMAQNIKFIEEEINLNIENCNGVLSVESFDQMEGVTLFELKLFMDCYNKGNTILIFDGFDEICPHYKSVAVALLKCLARKTFPTSGNMSSDNFEAKQKLWITSRPYNNIRNTLETEFGTSYKLKPFTDAEQFFFVEKYLRINLNLPDLNYQQFQNIDSIFEYMVQFSDSHKDISKIMLIKSTSAPLYSLYCAIIEYFQSEIKNSPLSANKTLFKDKWNKNMRWLKASELLVTWDHVYEEAMNLARTPLHMYLAVNYIDTQIKYSENFKLSHKWDLDTNTFAFYESFLESKLKKIRFEEKNHMNLQNPDLRISYERERVEFITKHKQLAFYSIFKNEATEILGIKEINEIQQTIRRIANGEEKTGLIEYVIKDVPKFVHLTFAEYLAVEYIADLLQAADTYEAQIKKWEFLLYVVLPKSSTGVLEVFDRKINSDPKLMDIVSNFDLKEFIVDKLFTQFSFLCDMEEEFVPLSPRIDYSSYIEQQDMSSNIEDEAVYFPGEIDASSDDLVEYISTTLDIAVYCGMKTFAVILLTAITDKVTNDNLDKFIAFIENQYFFLLSIKHGYNKILEIVINSVRRVDRKMLYEIYRFVCGRTLEVSLALDSGNKEIIGYLKANHNFSARLMRTMTVRKRFY